MKKVIITGGMGFLGQHLVKELATRMPDSRITILDRVKPPFFDPSIDRLQNVEAIGGIDVTSGEICRYFADTDIVFHLAAYISFWRKDKDELFRINVGGTENVVKACLDNKVKKLVYVSSTAALGYNNDKNNPMDESFEYAWEKAKGFEYMLSKYHAERKVKEACRQGLPAVIANPSTMFGPYDRKGFALIENLLSGKVPAMLPGGFSITDARDVARALVLMAEKAAVGENYLLIGGNYTYEKMLATFADVLGVPAPGKTLPMWLGPVLVPVISGLELIMPSQPKLTREVFAPGFKYRYYSSQKALEQLGWKPEIPLEKTFSDTYEFYRNDRSAK